MANERIKNIMASSKDTKRTVEQFHLYAKRVATNAEKELGIEVKKEIRVTSNFDANMKKFFNAQF